MNTLKIADIYFSNKYIVYVNTNMCFKIHEYPVCLLIYTYNCLLLLSLFKQILYNNKLISIDLYKYNVYIVYTR